MYQPLLVKVYKFSIHIFQELSRSDQWTLALVTSPISHSPGGDSFCKYAITTSSIGLVRPPGTLVPGGLNVLLQMFFFLATRSPSRETLPRDRNVGEFYNASPKIRGALPPKKLGAKNMQNSARFQTTSDFDRKYLRNETRYPKSESNMMISDFSRVPRESRVNFGPLTTENGMWVWTHLNYIFRETIFRPIGGAGPSNFDTHTRLTKAW